MVFLEIGKGKSLYWVNNDDKNLLKMRLLLVC